MLAEKTIKISNLIAEMSMFVGTTTIFDKVKHASNVFIPDIFFEHFDSYAYTSPMLDIAEVFDTPQDFSGKGHTSEVQ
jgi:hypothetical protein